MPSLYNKLKKSIKSLANLRRDRPPESAPPAVPPVPPLPQASATARVSAQPPTIRVPIDRSGLNIDIHSIGRSSQSSGSASMSSVGALVGGSGHANVSPPASRSPSPGARDSLSSVGSATSFGFRKVEEGGYQPQKRSPSPDLYFPGLMGGRLLTLPSGPEASNGPGKLQGVRGQLRPSAKPIEEMSLSSFSLKSRDSMSSASPRPPSPQSATAPRSPASARNRTPSLESMAFGPPSPIQTSSAAKGKGKESTRSSRSSSPERGPGKKGGKDNSPSA